MQKTALNQVKLKTYWCDWLIFLSTLCMCDTGHWTLRILVLPKGRHWYEWRLPARLSISQHFLSGWHWDG